MTKHKLTKEEIEEDLLVTQYYRAQDYYKTNRVPIIGGLLAVVILIIGSVGWSYYKKDQEKKAQVILAGTQQLFVSGDYEASLKGNIQAMGFEEIILDYSGTKAANLARYYSAVSHYELGNIEEALANLKKFEAPEGVFGIGTIAFHADLLSEQGDYKEAAKLYIKAAEWVITKTTTPLYYLSAADAYLKAGKKDKAVEFSNRVINDPEAGQFAAKAKRILGKTL